jgi:hypothetical protein
VIFTWLAIPVVIFLGIAAALVRFCVWLETRRQRKAAAVWAQLDDPEDGS